MRPPTAEERREIRRYEGVALSDGDLLRVLDGKVQIVLYPDIWRMSSLDEVLGPHGAAIILFCAKPSYGHWCALIRGVGGAYDTVEFFNPYGGYPDDSLDYLDKRWAVESRQDVPRLSILMLHSPYKLAYNEYQFQRRSSGVKTCGRHCATRVLLRDMSLDEYAAAIFGMAKKTGTTPDAVVSAITSEISPAVAAARARA